MNIHTHISEAEQRRSAAATRARLMGKPARVPPRLAPVVQIAASRKPVDVSYHMVLYRAYQKQRERAFAMSSSFQMVNSTEYRPYETKITFDFKTVVKTMKEIAMEVLDDYPGVSLEEVQGPRRTRNFVRPRQMAMYRIIKERPDLSYPMVGRFFGGRDHTTVLHAVRKIEKQRATA